MSSRPHVLSIDLGTSGPKVALVSDAGQIAASTTRRVATLRLPDKGAEQDAEAIWTSVCDAVREVVGRSGVPAQQIVGVGLVSQFFSLVPVDAEARPLSNLILWMDGRGSPFAHELLAVEGAPLTWLERHGMIPLPSGACSLSKMLWVQRERPEIYEKTHAFLEPMDYLAARLTGRFTANACTAFPLLVGDHRHPNEARWDEDLIRLSGIDRGKLPEMVPVGSQIGPLRREVAEELGLTAGTSVYSGINDTQAVAVGAGTARDGVGGVNVGTTGQVLAHTERRHTDMEHGIVSAPSPVPGRYLALAENGLGAGSLDHLMRNVFFTNDALADHRADDPFREIEAALSSSPPGARGMLFLPWLTGAVAPESEASMRGGFLNVSLETGRADMVRAVMEGIAYGLRWLLPAVEEFVGHEFTSLRFAGGAAVSEGWARIMADATGRPVHQLADARHVINRASAYLTFCDRGEVDRSQLETFCPVKREFEPEAEAAIVYDRLFEQFVRTFEQTRPIFQALNG